MQIAPLRLNLIASNFAIGCSLHPAYLAGLRDRFSADAVNGAARETSVSPANSAAVAEVRADLIQGMPPADQLKALNLLLKANLSTAGTTSPPELPDGLGTLIRAALSGSAGGATDPETQAALAALCLTALHFPPWQPEVRRLAARDPVGDGWNAVHQLIDVLDNEILPPGVALDFRPEGPGQGTLTWRF